MNSESRFEALTRRARNEVSPSVDVAGQVLAILAPEQARLERLLDTPLIWLAAFSSAAAVPITVLAVIIYNTWVGPLFEISQAITWVAQ